ncbi:NAD(P)H-dependent oxidoreductase [Schaalia sp. 19OD2882]|uniref:CE1759 family FMN reductase n=1 Tax=Schaalia sp. 19OD2882 TaxID=2794089 RepID=UPI001C1ED98A|nr:CE1759 family FMN reductase [Schaalia sp. 19OD2882]QWW19782.1 NAD(P)H-dependent oxidoreductase [Schaalia sp. 19OD2882]
MTRHVTIVHAGTSEHASTARLGALVEEHLQEVAAQLGLLVEVTWVHLRPLAHDIMDHLLTGFPGAALAGAHEQVALADGLILLTPTYQASYSGLFKSFVDTLPEGGLEGKPVLLGATGGTPRHALVTEIAMRPLATHLHADPVPTSLYAATEDWGAHAGDSDGRAGEALGRRVARAARELVTRLPVESRDGSASITPDHRATATESSRQDATGQIGEAAKWPGFVDFETLLGGGR